LIIQEDSIYNNQTAIYTDIFRLYIVGRVILDKEVRMSKSNNPWSVQILTPTQIIEGKISPDSEIGILLLGDYNYYKDRKILEFTDANINSINNPSAVNISVPKFIMKQRSGILAIIPLDEEGIRAFQKESTPKELTMRVVMYSGMYTIKATIKPEGLFTSGECYTHAKDATIEYQKQNSKNILIEAQWILINTERIHGYYPE